jgi:hypothetical protein
MINCNELLQQTCLLIMMNYLSGCLYFLLSANLLRERLRDLNPLTIKQGRKRPLDTSKRMIEIRERDS